MRPNPLAWQVSLPWQPNHVQRRKIEAQIDAGPDAGVPIGGLGAGTMTRGVNGGFTRWTLKAGQLFCFEQPENGFALWHEGHGARALRPNVPSGWTADPKGDQAALFPKAWHSYRSGGLTLVIEQMSPVVPELGDDCDLPVGVFRAHFTNAGSSQERCAVMLSFNNLCGWFTSFNGAGQPGGVAGQHNSLVFADGCAAVAMDQETAGTLDEGQGQMALAAAQAPGLEITGCAAFDPVREGAAFWSRFAQDGTAEAPGESWTSGGGFSEFAAAAPCGALSARLTLAPGESRTVDFALAWDFPVIRFGQGRRHLRHYTARWGATGRNAVDLAAHALGQADHWSAAIDRFHEDQAEQLDLPPASTALAINELYFLTDGLTVWTAPDATGREHFGLIECPDYPLYGTLDLWVYASAAVAHLFPELAATVTRAYAAETARADEEMRFHLRSSQRFSRQRPGMLPHDLGAPNADPFHKTNDYAYQDSGGWKDLNAMFVLCAWRDTRRDEALAAGYHPVVSQAIDALARFDSDGDGMIENDGTPDQTFDNIPMTGISAYCGGLWLAALRAAARIAALAGDEDRTRSWRALSARAEPAFEAALWTGDIFRLDSAGRFSDAILAEQLYGAATARMLGLGDTVDPDKAKRALETVYRANFIEAGKGRGLVAVASPVHDSSLYAPKGEEGLQWDEILTGFNYSFAAALRAYGMEEQCRTLLEALARELGEERGLHFRTPAALAPDRPDVRAQMNMRPLGIWALAEAARYRKG